MTWTVRCLQEWQVPAPTRAALVYPTNGSPTAVYPHIVLDDGRTFTNLVQIFDRGLKVAGPNAPYIGHRPTISTNPLKFANHFVWSTWGEIQKRRLDVGSGIESLFRSGGGVKANGLETVGLWAANIPGQSLFHVFRSSPRSLGISSRRGVDSSLTRH